MRRVTGPVWLALLVLAIGIAVAILSENPGGGGGESRTSSPDGGSIDTGDARLQGAGLLVETARALSAEPVREVVSPAPPVSVDPTGSDEVVGIVVDPEERPVVAHLMLFVDGEPPKWGASTTTDAKGRFRMRPRGLRGVVRTDASPWTGVVALWRPYASTAPLTPTHAGAPPMRIVARPARDARVSVIDEEGRPVPLARVRIGPPIATPVPMSPRPWIERADEIAASLGFERRADRAGVALVRQSPTPTSALGVTAPLGRDLAPATYAGWDGGDVIIRMTGKPRVEGIVRETGGGLLADGTVWWRLAGTQEWHDVGVQSDGTFSIDCGAAGAIELCPRMRTAFPRPPEASRVVPSGAMNVSLLAEEGPTLDLRLGGWTHEAQGLAELIRESSDAEDAPHMWVAVEGGRILVRGLDAGARYTLWVPPLSGSGGQPVEADPRRLFCVLRAGLVPAGGPVHVSLTASRPVSIRLAPTEPGGGWTSVATHAHSHGIVISLADRSSSRVGENDPALRMLLPAGPMTIRVGAFRLVSPAGTGEDPLGPTLVLPYAGTATWDGEADTLEVPVAPTSRDPVPMRGW